MSRIRPIFGAIVLLATIPVFAETKILLDFETPDDLRMFEFKAKSGQIVQEHATHGNSALRIQDGEYMNAWRENILGSWSGYDVLRFDYFNTTGAPVNMSVLVGDKAWQTKDGGTYWNRHNSGGVLAPGAGTFTLPVKGLYRGEAGSRNNDIKRNIDVDSIVRLDLGFNGKPGDIFIDYLRLESASVPAWVKAFDFGPSSQPLEPGFTGVSFDTIYSDAQGYGYDSRRRAWGSSAARDDTFPTPLLEDFVESNDCLFRVALADGDYHVWMVYDDLGYWGGEQARHTKRSVSAGDKVVYDESRPEGWAKALYEFQDIEPLPGIDMWNTYMTKLFKPAEFDVTVAGGKLELSFKADAPWSCKVAAIIIYPKAKQAEGQKFVADLWDEQKKTFVSKAVEMPAPKGEMDAGLAGQPVILFSLDKDEAVIPTAVPKPEKVVQSIELTAARGENEPIVLGMRAIGEMKNVTVKMDGLTGPNGAAIAKENIKPQVAWYIARRGFNAIRYDFETHTLRPAEGFSTPAGIAREIWVDIKVPQNAVPGNYKGILNITWTEGTAQKSLTKPVKLTVMPFTLNPTQFCMGFYGITPPDELAADKQVELQRGLFNILREYGMNSFSGGRDVVLKGFNNGEPVMDFTAADEFMKLARNCGFSKTYINYGGGGIAGLYSPYGYTKGDVGTKLEKDTGLPYEEICRKTLDAYKKHADENNYLPVILNLVDETRVVEDAKVQLELQKTLRKAAPWLMIGGSYSVSFAGKADELHSLLQEMFKTLRVNVMNGHDQSVLDMAKQLGTDVWIYNQGQSRYSFGYYQWSEYMKGVKGRMQWHLFPLHGWQYFDLDGREPDTGVIAYHSKYGILPTLNLARVREGVEDMLYCQTLSDLAAKNPNHPKAADAKALLDKINSGIKLGQRQCPGWLDQDKVRADLAALIVAMQGK